MGGTIWPDATDCPWYPRTGTSWKAGSPAKGVLHALARRVAGTAAETLHAQATLEHPPAPLPGYHIAEIPITGGSPPAGRKLGDVSWPLASISVSVLRVGSVHPASRGITPAPGDRVSLLVPATQDPQPQDTERQGEDQDQPTVHPRTGTVSPKSQPPPFGMTPVALQ
jgi:hypothetical protein